MSPQFSVGDRVHVRQAYPPGHVRTPHFIRGKTGVVANIAGEFANPEELAYGRDGLPKLALYHISFRQTDLWSEYDGQPADTTVVAVYENWLDAAEGGER